MTGNVVCKCNANVCPYKRKLNHNLKNRADTKVTSNYTVGWEYMYK